jgi:predicted nucleic acid-binding protein
MRLFLDTSVLLAAAGSATGASRFVLEEGASHGWQLITSGYCIQETVRNVAKFGPLALQTWNHTLEPLVGVVPDSYTLNRALVFPKAKDRPVLISALAADAHTLLTLDQTDFHGSLGPQVYGMEIRTPSAFIIQLRLAGLL